MNPSKGWIKKIKLLTAFGFVAVSSRLSAQTLNSVFFEFGRSRTTAEARATLHENAKWIKNHPGTILQIEGYCDRRGSSSFNYKLGLWRAQSVKKYLEKLGVSTDAFKAVVSFGSDAFVDDGTSSDANKINRRVTLKIVERPADPVPVHVPAQATLPPSPPPTPPTNTSWGLEINPKVFYSRIDALDTGTVARATLVSSLNEGIDIGLDHKQWDHWTTSFHFEYSSIQNPPPPGQSLLNSSVKTDGYVLQLKNKAGERLSYSVSGAYEQDLFLAARSLSILSTDTNFIPKAKAKFDYDLVRIGIWNWNLEAEGDYMFAASGTGYTVNPGAAVGGKFYFIFDFPNLPIHVGVGYLRQFQNTTISSQVEQELSFETGFTWRF